MKNGLLQFIKKINLAILLAKNDSLGILEGIRSFNGIHGMVHFFYRKQYPDSANNIRCYLKNNKDDAMQVVYDEISSRKDIFKVSPSPILFEEKTILNDELLNKTAIDEENADFYTELATEIVHDEYPKLKEELSIFCRRMEKLSDMRLYGAEVEDLNEILKKIDSAFPLNVNWNKTGKGELTIDVLESLTISQELSPEAQENLLQTIAKLFFEHSVFISCFRAVMVNFASKINFYDFDRIYSVDDSLRDFLQAYIEGQAEPTKTTEFKLARLLTLLEYFCPDYNVADYLQKISSEYPLKKQTFSETDAEAKKKL